MTPGTWIPKSITTSREVKTCCFPATPGKMYKIYWDDSYSGSRQYTCDIKVSAFRQDATTAYFTNVDSGYMTPRTITVLDNLVFIKVAGYYAYSTGTFALKVVQAN